MSDLAVLGGGFLGLGGGLVVASIAFKLAAAVTTAPLLLAAAPFVGALGFSFLAHFLTKRSNNSFTRGIQRGASAMLGLSLLFGGLGSIYSMDSLPTLGL